MELPSPDTPARLADLGGALADPTRLRILLLLARCEEAGFARVCILLDGVSQPLASHHLAVLRRHRLVACRRAGRERVYRLGERVGVGAGSITMSGVGGLRVTVQRPQT